MRVSVVLPISPRARALEATVESYAAQRDCELVLVGDGDAFDRAAARAGDRLRLVPVRRPITTRGAARAAGVAASSGDVILLAAEDQPALPGWLEALARAHVGEPALVVGAGPREDPLWARVAPLLERFGERLDGLALPWLAALGGHYSLPRRALDEPLDGGYRGWEGDDLDLPFRWWRRGRPIRVSREAGCGGASRELEDWPPILAADLARFAERHGALDGWLLWRFLRRDAFDAIHGVALERSRGRSTALAELERVAGELLSTSLRATETWWRP